MRQILNKSPLFRAALLAALIVPAGACMAQEDKAGAQPAAGETDAAAPDAPLAPSLAAAARPPANVARDQYRHPAETLAFFGVDPGDTVVELWPGGGWYTEVLAPYLTAGALYVVPPTGNYDERIRAKVASDPVYSDVKVATFTAGQPTAVPAGSGHGVLTSPNAHN